MFTKLINYSGIDNFNKKFFKYYLPFKFEGNISMEDNIEEILSFSLDKNLINYKILNTFTNVNNENFEVKSNLIVINNKFDLTFEYSSVNEVSKLKAFNKVIFKSFLISLDDYYDYNLNIEIFILDLLCNKIDSHTIFYCVNLIIGVNPV